MDFNSLSKVLRKSINFASMALPQAYIRVLVDLPSCEFCPGR
jgi:hypothetical protein